MNRYYGKERLGLLKDGTIVIIHSWSDAAYLSDDDIQDIYFRYRFMDKIKLKRSTAFALEVDFIKYSNSVRELKKYWKTVK